MKRSIFFMIVFVLLAPVSILFAQSKAGTTIAQFLKIEPSARAAALGNAGTSLYGEAASLYYNPASLGRLDKIDAQFTYNKWLADINYNYAVVGVPLQGIGTLALQITSLNSGEMDVRTVEQPLGTGERFSVTNFALGIGYGMMLTDRVSVGLQMTYFQESIWHSSLTGFALNIGVQYQVEVDGLTIGAALMNFGPRAKYEGRDAYVNFDFDPKKYGDNDQLPAQLRMDEWGLPTAFRVGMSYPVRFSKDYKLILTADAFHPNDNKESISLGGEFQLLDIFYVRGGYRNLFLEDLEGGAVLGGGVKASISGGYVIRFDYAWADYGRLDQAHRFTFGIGF
ncbi:MAG: PorV/PorQ family protein [Ignavibacteriaceae bacterium]|nr:PorV/PorQ family protein [Ignavibacteriaceae bacterium]